MRSDVCPKAMAQEIRRKAQGADGEEREHLLWIASEWEKLASGKPARTDILKTEAA